MLKQSLQRALRRQHLLYFVFLFTSVFLIFKNSFNISFFSDDFFFLTIGKANTLGQFLHFFNPFKNYFYRPVPTEFFYFIINFSHQNLFVGHFIVLITYFVGLYFLFKNSLLLTKNKKLSYIFVFMYGISFIHVFQLYMLNTFQEICLFTFMMASFYFYVLGKRAYSVLFFLLALLSKETAIFYPIFPLIYTYWKNGFINYKKYYHLAIYFFISLVFLFIYKQGVSSVEQIEIYQIHPEPRLILNNLTWYTLWSLGLPNFLPNYVKSIFFKPLPEFWNLLKSNDIRTYFHSLIIFYSLFLVTFVGFIFENLKKIRKFFYLFVLCLFLFLFFVSPTLPIIHKWMVRLTIPLIFIVFFQAYLLYYFSLSKNKLIRISGLMLLLIYIFINIIGTQIHESSGLFTLETEIVNRASIYFSKHEDQIVKSKVIYFSDDTQNYLGGSRELDGTFHNQDFLSYFFPNKKLSALYAYKKPKTIPKGTYVIKSADILNANP